jgi:hypothetical protein
MLRGFIRLVGGVTGAMDYLCGYEPDPDERASYARA